MISKYGTITKAWINIHRSVLERAFGTEENKGLQIMLERESSRSVSMSEQHLARILANCLRGIKLVFPTFFEKFYTIRSGGDGVAAVAVTKAVSIFLQHFTS